jgi:glycosyltransferase involved in cell wall biosynthesis
MMKACHALAQLDQSVAVWVPGSPGDNLTWEELASLYELNRSFEVHWLITKPALKRYDFTWKSLRAARHWKADLIYTWMSQVALLALWQGLPVIYEMHDRPTGNIGPWLFRQFARSSGKRRLMLITDALRHVLEREQRVKLTPDWVQVAPNGVDLNAYLALPDPEGARRQLGLKEAFTVGYTGHFYAGRGLDLLLGLAQALPDIQFLWVGGTPEDVHRWQARLQMMDIHNVTLTGFIKKTQLPLYQAAAEVLLMPYETAIAGSSGGNSVEICSPMKMFDYLATGRVIITSDLPVLHEVLDETKAVFCPPQDVPAWTAALLALAQNPQRCQQLSQAARQAASRYTWTNRAERALQGFLD